MQVFKFGGASVKDAAGVQNVAKILSLYANQPLVVVISAMGKTTNALEEVVKSIYYQKNDRDEKLAVVENYHTALIQSLFASPTQPLAYLAERLDYIQQQAEQFAASPMAYDELYDQIVSVGELLSTKIVQAYLAAETTLKTTWLDAREFIRTDDTYREGRIDWPETKSRCNALKATDVIQITQGFIGGNNAGKTTTLGREGSDYTASIIAYCVDAEAVTIWKDVDGVLSADPRLFNDFVKFDQLSYHEAIEMTYYGATVIHPKTIKPLQNAGIPLYVKPFLQPEASGTVINAEPFRQKHISAIIVKKNQALVSISSKDFSFFTEADMSAIYQLMAKHQVKSNVAQQSALSFTVGVDEDEMKFQPFIAALKERYQVKYNNQLTLYTLRHYTDDALANLLTNKELLLEQYSRSTAQLMCRELL